MEFNVLLSVLAITQTIVLARPTDTVSKTKRSINEESIEGIKPATEGLTINLPTALQHGLKININGHLDTNSDSLEIVFPSHRRNEEEYCRFIYNFENETMYFSEDLDDYTPYSLFTIGETRRDYPPFTLELQGQIENEMNVLQLNLNLNNAEETLKSCYLERFEDFERIEFRKGLHSITSLLMKF